MRLASSSSIRARVKPTGDQQAICDLRLGDELQTNPFRDALLIKAQRSRARPGLLASCTASVWRKRISPPARTAAGHRLYDEAALKRLRFIKQAQSLGFSLDEIQRILNLRGRVKETCRCVLAMAEATLSETEEKLTELQRFRDGLKTTLGRWRRRTADARQMNADFCALIESSEK